MRVQRDGEDLGRTDVHGHLIATNLRPFDRNVVRLDTSTLNADDWVDESEQTVRPFWRGVVAVRFASTADSFLAKLRRPDGEPVPAGARVTEPAGNWPVGEDGLVSLPMAPDLQRLRVEFPAGPASFRCIRCCRGCGPKCWSWSVNSRRVTMLLALFALCVCSASRAACIGLLYVTVTPVDFLTYDPLSPSAREGAGTLTLGCFGLGLLPNASVKLSAGASGSFGARQLKNGTHKLDYNLYQDSGRNTIWGDGTGTSSFQSFQAVLSLGSQIYTVFGKIPPDRTARLASIRTRSPRPWSSKGARKSEFTYRRRRTAPRAGE